MKRGAIKPLNTLLVLGLGCLAGLLVQPSSARALDSNQRMYLNTVRSKMSSQDPKSITSLLDKRLAYETQRYPVQNADFVLDLIALKFEAAARQKNEAVATETIAALKKVIGALKGDAQLDLIQKAIKSPIIDFKLGELPPMTEAFRRKTKIKTLESLFEQCASSTPKCGGYFPLGYALHGELRKLQDNDGLIALLKQLIKTADEYGDKSKQFDFRLRMVYAQRKAGDLDGGMKSIAEAEKFLDSAPGGRMEGMVSIESERAYLLSLKKEFDQADKVVENLLKTMKPEELDAPTRYYLELERPKILHYKGQPKEALKALESIFALQKTVFANHPGAKHSLFWTTQFAGLVHAQNHDPAEAYESLKKAKGLSSDNPFFRIWINFYFALAALGVGRHDEATSAVHDAESDLKYLEAILGKTDNLGRTAKLIEGLAAAKEPATVKSAQSALVQYVNSYSVNDLPTSLGVEVLTSNIKDGPSTTGSGK